MIDPLPTQRPGPMPFRLLIDEAMRQSRRHFRALYLPVALPVAVMATLMSVGQALWFPRLIGNPDPRETLAMLPGFYLLIFVFIGIFSIALAALQIGVVKVLNGQPADMKSSWRRAFEGRVLGTLVLWYAAFVASFLCCCLPALFVLPLLSFYVAIMADEERFGLEALRRSAELTLHPTGPGFFDRPIYKVFLFLVVSAALSYAVGLLVSLPFQIPMWIAMFRQSATGGDPVAGMTGMMWLQVPSQFLNALVTTAVYIYSSFGIALLFYDARGRKDGGDLRSRIQDVFSVPPPELPLG